MKTINTKKVLRLMWYNYRSYKWASDCVETLDKQIHALGKGHLLQFVKLCGFKFAGKYFVTSFYWLKVLC